MPSFCAILMKCSATFCGLSQRRGCVLRNLCALISLNGVSSNISRVLLLGTTSRNVKLDLTSSSRVKMS